MTETVHGVPLRDFEAEPLQVLSFGGGTQSSAMLLMVGKGMLPKPDIVIFSDTGSEEKFTIDHVENVAKPYVEQVLQVPFAIVKPPKPLHVAYRERETIPMIGVRSCTQNYKIAPQRRFVREIVGSKNGVLLAQSWLGITTDEARRRVDETDVIWYGVSYPLLDDVPTSRQECLNILGNQGWEVQKSGCWLCPYVQPRHWPKLKARRPDLFDLAVDMEEAVIARQIRNGRNPENIRFNRGGVRLKVIQDMKSLWHYSDEEEPEDNFTCDSGAGCFI